MIAAGFFTESLGFDLGVLATLLTILGAVVGGFFRLLSLLKESKQTRAEEIRSVVSELINSSPDKVVISPQPLIVEMKKEFAMKSDIDAELTELRRRIGALESYREIDRKDLSEKIEAVPAKVIALLLSTKSLHQS